MVHAIKKADAQYIPLIIPQRPVTPILIQNVILLQILFLIPTLKWVHSKAPWSINAVPWIHMHKASCCYLLLARSPAQQ